MPRKKPLHKIGVLADTHGRFLPRLAEVFRDVTELWHLGDVCDLGLLDELRKIHPNLSTVRGNNDHGLVLPETLHLERGGESFYLVHIFPRRLPSANWLLFGHTHRPLDEVQQGVHLLNPGSAGKANKGAPLSVAVLTQTVRTAPFRAELVLL